MTQGFLLPLIGLWALSFAGYAAAGLLMWRRRIHRTVHILLTVGAFLLDIVALALINIHMMQVGRSIMDVPIGLRGAHNTITNTSIGAYCVVAVLGFSRTVGWHKLGRWHVPAALTFLGVWIAARVCDWLVLSV
jgi:hypothetical protein